MIKHVNEDFAAAFLGCSKHMLQRRRRTGGFIPYKKIGRNVRYDMADLEEYLRKQTFTSTSAY